MTAEAAVELARRLNETAPKGYKYVAMRTQDEMKAHATGGCYVRRERA